MHPASRVAVPSCCRPYGQVGVPDSLCIIASEDSRDWQRTRVHGARSRQGKAQGPRAWALGGSAQMVWHDKAGQNWPLT